MNMRIQLLNEYIVFWELERRIGRPFWISAILNFGHFEFWISTILNIPPFLDHFEFDSSVCVCCRSDEESEGELLTRTPSPVHRQGQPLDIGPL